MAKIVLLNTKSIVWSLLLILLSGCGGGSGAEKTEIQTTPPVLSIAEPDYWDIPTPDFSARTDRTVITINGPHTVLLPLNGDYEELNAKAIDPQGGDVSEQLVIEHQIDSSVAGDYLVRYSLPGTDGVLTLDAVRVVRVGDEEMANFSRRPFGSTMSHLGYIEHLPENYGHDLEQRFPLLIYNHGNVANASFSGNFPVEALEAVLFNGGLPDIIRTGQWDKELPFIVLMPQASFVESSTPAERMNAFLDYAVQTYAIDVKKVYMTGWSQGGLMSIDYAINYPEKLAATVSIAGGNPFNEDLPQNFCDMEHVPMWIFHGDNDEVVDAARSLDLYTKLTQQCQPTILPKLTIFSGENHQISQPVFDLSSMIGGALGTKHIEEYDAYDQSIYEWLLSHDSE